MFTKARDPMQREPSEPSAGAMPRKTPRAAPSIVSADMTIVGAITAGGDIQVDGKVEGDIITDALTVGEKAMIKGEVLAEEVIVRGVVQGSIKAEKVQLCAGARVHGDILHAALAVETGALFEGNCRHSEDPLGRKSDKPQTDSVARMETGPAAAQSEAPPPPKPEPAKPEPAPAAETESSPAARFKPNAAAKTDSMPAENGKERSEPSKAASNDLGKMSPGRMRAGAEEPAPAASAKGK